MEPYSQSWRPEGAPRALVVISHGMGEHVGRYGAVAGRLTARGCVVDAPGHREPAR
jgi:alpha-beta hydrolase superfamily lysophospholipase